MLIDETRRRLLEAIGECAWVTADISHLCEHSIPYFNMSRRIRSGAFHSWLCSLKKEGLVELLDNKRPKVWKATVAGKAWLSGKREDLEVKP